MISPLAYIHPEAKIGENVEIGPFVFIDKNVVIGDNNTIMPNANILYGSRIGNGNTIFPGAVIGAIPQDLKFRGEETTAEIGDNNTIRENVTINRGTKDFEKTAINELQKVKEDLLKTAPQINVFQLSFLFKPVFGAAILIWIMPMLVNVISDFFLSFAQIF